MYFKHEQSKVLLTESDVEIKRRTQPACYEYIDTIVGMRLDQLSYEIHGNSLEDSGVINTTLE